jgi:hypothetical protein
MSHPPQFNSTIKVQRKARFQVTSVTTGSTTLSLTRKMLLNHLVVATAANTCYRILSGIRLKSLTLWSMGISNTSGLQYIPVTHSVEWTSTYGPSVIVSDTSMSVRPAFISTSPPKNSLASFWSLTGFNETDVIAIIDYTPSTVIDMTYEVIIQNGESPVSATTTLTMTVGNLYMSYLDGLLGAGQISPVSYASIS